MSDSLLCPRCNAILSFKRPLMAWGTLRRAESKIVEEVWEDTEHAGDMEVFCINVEECGFTIPRGGVKNVISYIDALRMFFDHEQEKRRELDETK